MNALEQLIRVHSWSLDEKRRQAVELDRLADKLRGDLSRVDAEMEAEKKSVGLSLELAPAFAAYLKVAQGRRARLLRSIADVEAEILRVQAEVADAYQQLKKYEQALANRNQRERLKVTRREQIANDELGLAMYQRRR